MWNLFKIRKSHTNHEVKHTKHVLKPAKGGWMYNMMVFTKNFHMFETKHALKPPLYRRNFMGFLSSLQLATSRYPNIGLPSHLHSRPWHGAPSDVFGIFLAPIFGISRREALNSPWSMVPKPKHTPHVSFTFQISVTFQIQAVETLPSMNMGFESFGWLNRFCFRLKQPNQTTCWAQRHSVLSFRGVGGCPS